MDGVVVSAWHLRPSRRYQGAPDAGQGEQAQGGQHDPAAAEPGQQELGNGPDRHQKEYDGTLDGVALLVQHVPKEGGCQRGKQPEHREGGERGYACGDKLTPAQLRDAQTGEAQGGPVP